MCNIFDVIEFQSEEALYRTRSPLMYGIHLHTWTHAHSECSCRHTSLCGAQLLTWPHISAPSPHHAERLESLLLTEHSFWAGKDRDSMLEISISFMKCWFSCLGATVKITVQSETVKETSTQQAATGTTAHDLWTWFTQEVFVLCVLLHCSSSPGVTCWWLLWKKCLEWLFKTVYCYVSKWREMCLKSCF